MSDSFESLRRSSHLGPKSGLTLNQSQQILQMNEMKQKSRRVSLNANSVCSQQSSQSPQLPLESTQADKHSSLETLSRPQSSQSTTSATPFDLSSLRLDSSSAQTRKTSKSETQLQNQCNSYCVNNYSNSCLSGGSSSATMLPIVSYDNIVMSRPSLNSMDMTGMNGRMSRRSSKATQEAFTCSQQSILSAMDRFVKAVNNMDSTVLVPSKLRDMDMASTGGPTAKLMPIPPALANTDLHSFYLMLNDVKKELLWGPAAQHNTNLTAFSGRTSPRDLKHIRQPSDDSLGSLGSTASSSSDQDTDSEADSLMTDRDSVDEHTSHLAAAFRHHLQGLHTILHQLADSADYLSSRYQEDIDASSL